jgi:hypothetical protein
VTGKERIRLVTITQLRHFEGLEVEVDFEHGHISEATLISAVGGQRQEVWLEVDGEDLFVPLSSITSVTPKLSALTTV